MKYIFILIFVFLSIDAFSQTLPPPVIPQLDCTLPLTYKWDSYHVLTPKLMSSDNHLYVLMTYEGDSSTHFHACYLTHNLRTGLTVWNGDNRWAAHYHSLCEAVADWNKMLVDHGKE